MGTLSALFRYPVKSMLGEAVRSAEVTSRGLAGDRMFAVLDEADAVGSAKHPRKWGALLRCRSRLSDPWEATVELPDGTALRTGDADLDWELSRLIGRRVMVSDKPPHHGTLERAVPDYAGGVPEAARAAARVDETGDAITSGSVRAGTFFDFGQVHLVTTTSLNTLRSAYPAGDFDVRRFRPNLVVETPPGLLEHGFPEDDWIGSTLRIGEAAFEVVVPTPRCVIPTLPHDELPADAEIMRTVARMHRVPVFTLGPLSCVGVYLNVVRPGQIRVGDVVRAGG